MLLLFIQFSLTLLLRVLLCFWGLIFIYVLILCYDEIFSFVLTDLLPFYFSFFFLILILFFFYFVFCFFFFLTMLLSDIFFQTRRQDKQSGVWLQVCIVNQWSSLCSMFSLYCCHLISLLIKLCSTVTTRVMMNLWEVNRNMSQNYHHHYHHLDNKSPQSMSTINLHNQSPQSNSTL